MGKSEPHSTTFRVELPPVAMGLSVANPIMAKAWMDLATEAMTFANEQMARQMAFQADLLAAKTPADALSVQTQFVTATMARYGEEAARYAQMWMGATGSIIDDARTGHRRAYDDVPV